MSRTQLINIQRTNVPIAHLFYDYKIICDSVSSNLLFKYINTLHIFCFNIRKTNSNIKTHSITTNLPDVSNGNVCFFAVISHTPAVPFPFP